MLWTVSRPYPSHLYDLSAKTEPILIFIIASSMLTPEMHWIYFQWIAISILSWSDAPPACGLNVRIIISALYTNTHTYKLLTIEILVVS